MAEEELYLGSLGPFLYDPTKQRPDGTGVQGLACTSAPVEDTDVLRKAEIGGGGPVAPTTASFVVMALDGDLSAERRLQVGNSLSLVDNGANADVTLNAIQDIRTSASPAFAGLNLTAVPVGVDNTVLVMNGNVVSSDEIDPRVWGATLVAASGTPTAGHIPYFTAAYTIAMDSGQLFWDAANNRLGIGTAGPGATLELQSSSPVLRLRDTGATASATTAFVEFGGTDAAAWSRTGFVGDAASANTDIYLQAEISDLHLGDSSSANVLNLQGGNVGIGLTTVDANYKLIIRRAADVNLGIGLQSSELALAAFNDALSANVPMRFYASEFNFLNGSFGIGTAAPTSLLHVSGASAAVRADATSGNPIYRLSESGVTRGTLRYDVTSHHVELAASSENADVVLIPNGTGGVGIGTAMVPYLLTLKDTGDMGNQTFTSSIFTGSGWALEYETGRLVGGSGASVGYHMVLDHLTVRGTFSIYEMLIQQIRATNGSVFVTACGKAESLYSGTWAVSNSVIIQLEDNSPFAPGDLMRAKRVEVDSTGTQVTTYEVKATVTATDFVNKRITVTLDVLSGAATSSDVVESLELVRQGNTTDASRRDSIYLTSDDNDSPFMEFIDGVAAWADWGTDAVRKGRLGNLVGSGYSNYTSGNYPNGIYGVAFGDSGGEYFTVDPTNGFRILDGGQGDAVMLQASASQLSVGIGFVYTTADTTLKVAGWTTTSSLFTKTFETDHEVTINAVAKSIYFLDGSPEAGDVHWLGMGKLYDGASFPGDEGIGMVVNDGTVGVPDYKKYFWLSQNEKSIASWNFDFTTLYNLTANVGVKLDAGNQKIQVGDLDEQHIDLNGADGTIKWYKSDGAGGDTLVITIDDSVYLGKPGIKILGPSYKTTVIPLGVYIAHPSSGVLYATLTGTGDGGYLALRDEASALFFQVFQSITATRIYASALESATGTDLIIDSGSYIKKKTSSKRYKKNIRPLEIDSSIIYKAPPSTFEWRVNNLTDHGLIAEDLSDLHPDLAFYNSDGKAESVNQGALMALTIAELKKLRTDVDKLITQA